MRVPGPVREHVVAPVIGDPADDRAFDCQGPGDREGDPYPGGGVEPAVGEHPVVPDGDAEDRDAVQADEQAEVKAGDAAPEQPHPDEKAHERREGDHEGEPPLQLHGPGGLEDVGGQ